MYSRSPSYTDTVGLVLKALVGLGIIVVTVSMILVLADALSFANSVFLQLMVAGGVVMSMAFLSLRIFERI